jgi:hypothetical protein
VSVNLRPQGIGLAIEVHIIHGRAMAGWIGLVRPHRPGGLVERFNGGQAHLWLKTNRASGF